MAIVFLKTPGAAFDVTEEADAIREDLIEIEKSNRTLFDAGAENFISWIELTSKKVVGGTPEAPVHHECPIHIKIVEIVAVGT